VNGSADIRSPSEGLPLEPSPEQLHHLLARAASLVEEFVGGVSEAPAWGDDTDAALHERVRATVSEAPGRLEEALELVGRGLAEGFNTAGPGFMAYIPGGGLISAGAADLIACAVNRYIGIAQAAPVMVEIEWRVVRWLCELFGYPSVARGILTSGGSMANFSAIVAARHAHLGEELSAGTLYVTDQAHHSIRKAALLAGLPSAAVRLVPRDSDLQMDPEALTRMIGADRREGRRPFLVVASAGTTNTGAVDPIAALVDVARREGVWLHVDGAYGGFFQLTERGRSLFQGIDRADSITLDPHKCMFLPYGTGALVVRDGEALRAAHAATADYLQDLGSEDDALPNFAEYSAEFTRSFRGLRVWLPLEVHGVNAFRAALDEKLDLARWLHEELAGVRGFELPWEPILSVVTFRYHPAGGDPDAATRQILRQVNASRRVFFSSTTIDGRLYVRPCIVVHRTHRDRVEEALALIKAAAAADLG
jgi:aromatic-L-amino-acid/L-tryptophan decarboxylase